MHHSGHHTHWKLVRYFQSADVLELTGLTRSQLREWSSRDRRNLVIADVEPEGPGRHALFKWQTVLALRLLKEMQTRFAVEVAAWAPAINSLRQVLDGQPFQSLWRSSVCFPSCGQVELIELNSAREFISGIVLPLDPHLLVIATKLCIPPPDQLPLFPAVAVRR